MTKENKKAGNYYQEWLNAWNYHQEHHMEFYKPVLDNADTIGVNIYGWFGGMFSIGIVALKFAQAALLDGLLVNAIHPYIVSPKKYVPPTDLAIELSRSCSQPVNLVFVNALETVFFHDDIPSSIRNDKYNIGYWLWELDIIPDSWIPWLQHFDEVWCASSFIKDSIQKSPGYDGTIIKVLPIPQDLSQIEQSDTEIDIPQTSPLAFLMKLGSSKPFVFLVVFDFQSFVIRKNPEASIKAFIKAFPLAQDLHQKHMLIVKGHSGTAEEVDGLRKVAQNDPRIVIINQLISQEENEQLHRYQDCYVSLHRSEGYGMNILESMESGMPVIATNYSANVDFFQAIP